MSSSQQNHFTVIVNGQIEFAEYPGASSLACAYQFVYGPDWEVVRVTGESASLESGMTQIAQRSTGCKSTYVWNFPIEIVFKTTNPWGWPKIVCSLCEVKGKNKMPICGYGWTHVPTFAGRYVNTVRLFAPRASSLVQSIMLAVQGKTPEFVNPTFAADGEGRECTYCALSYLLLIIINTYYLHAATRVKNEGAIRIRWDVMIKDIAQFGFDVKKQIGKAKQDEPEESLLDSQSIVKLSQKLD